MEWSKRVWLCMWSVVFGGFLFYKEVFLARKNLRGELEKMKNKGRRNRKILILIERKCDHEN